jgi:hypothetical protein
MTSFSDRLAAGPICVGLSSQRPRSLFPQKKSAARLLIHNIRRRRHPYTPHLPTRVCVRVSVCVRTRRPLHRGRRPLRPPPTLQNVLCAPTGLFPAHVRARFKPHRSMRAVPSIPPKLPAPPPFTSAPPPQEPLSPPRSTPSSIIIIMILCVYIHTHTPVCVCMRFPPTHPHTHVHAHVRAV